MGVRGNFSRGLQRRYLAYTFQIAEMQMDFHKTLYLFYQAYSQVLRFSGQNTFLRGKYFFYYRPMLKTDFTGHNKIGRTKNYLGCHFPRIPPRGYGPVFFTKTTSYVTATVIKMRFFGTNSQVH